MLGKTALKLVVIILELSLLIIHKSLQFKVLNKTPIKKKNNLTTLIFPDHLPLLIKMFLKMMSHKILDSAKLAIKIVLLVVLDLSIIS